MVKGQSPDRRCPTFSRPTVALVQQSKQRDSLASDQFFVKAQKKIHSLAHTVQTKMQKWLMKQVMPWKETKALEKHSTHPGSAASNPDQELETEDCPDQSTEDRPDHQQPNQKSPYNPSTHTTDLSITETPEVTNQGNETERKELLKQERLLLYQAGRPPDKLTEQPSKRSHKHQRPPGSKVIQTKPKIKYHSRSRGQTHPARSTPRFRGLKMSRGIRTPPPVPI